jgi:hypothetical protein
MRPIDFVLYSVVASLVLAGCGDSGTPATDTPATPDTAQADVTQVDTASPDAGTLDVGMPDSGAADAGADDAGVDDTMPSDAGMQDTGMPDVAMPEDTGGIEPVSFTTVFNEVLSPKGCTGGYCHAGHAGGLLMDSMETAYENLINKEASTPTDCEATIRVVPGDPAASMLWIRVRPDVDDCLTAEQKMPPFGDDALSDEERQLIYDWILTGANP